MTLLRRLFGWSTVALVGLGLGSPPVRADFQLRDGDTLVFLGDSITAERTYGKIVENYTLLRFPERHVRFINAGIGGDTAAGGLKRLDRDVLDAGATVVVVAYGINDIGWGTKADDEHRNLYLDSIRRIVERCKERHVRVFIASAAITNEAHDHGDTDYLQLMNDDGMAIARDLGERSIDIQRAMRPIHRAVRAARPLGQDDKDKPSLHTPDGIHLNELGQMAMAFAVLKGLEAPADVSSVALDLRDLAAVDARGCEVTKVAGDAARLTFDRLDAGLPLNIGVFGQLRFRFVPLADELNRYTLTVRNLPEGQYDVAADGRALGHWSAEQLGKGVNIASATANGWEPGGPWEAQAWILRQLTDARNEAASAFANFRNYLPEHPGLDQVRRQAEATNARLIEEQRAVVRPRAFHFVVEPHREAAKKP